MDLLEKKSYKSKIIRAMFSAIKKDNFEKFSEIIKSHPEMLYFKNYRRENILFYAFENDSKKIIDYINTCEPNLIKEKNIRNLNILHELILANKNIEYFLESMNYWNPNDIQQLFINADPQGNNVILMAAKSGSLEVLNKVVKSCPFFKELQSHSNIYGQTVAHFIAAHITEDCDEIIKTLSPNLLKTLDNTNGFSPLMLSAYHQREKNFKSFFDVYPYDQESFLNSNLIHFAAHNPDPSIVRFLISKDLFKNNRNIAEQSALMISMIKGNDKVAEELFSEAKKDKVYQEDIVSSVKIASKNPDLFSKIINNETNEDLNNKNVNDFFEDLFLHAKYQTILEVEKNEKYRNVLKNIQFVTLFSKTLTGKKDMFLKTNLLLKEKDFLTKMETIDVVNSLQKIPANQIKLILKSTNILEKISEEHKVLLSALCLGKGIEHQIIQEDLIVNKDEYIQKNIRNLLRNVRIEDTSKHFYNLELWLNLIDDKKVVWKHYGRIIAKNAEPFLFLEDKFRFLPREHKKELIYYVVTALFKDQKQISEESFRIIKKHTNLLTNVFVGIIKAGKIPNNEQLLETIPKIRHKALGSEDIVELLKRNNKNPKETIDLLKKTIKVFDLSIVSNLNEFCTCLVNNEFHNEIAEELAMNMGGSKDEFMYAYVEAYINKPQATINMNVLEQLILSHDSPSEVIYNITTKALLNPEFHNVEFIKRINYLNNFELLPELTYAQNLLDKENFQSCLKLQQIDSKSFQFKKLNFTNIDWESIEQKTITMDKSNKFFEFIAYNSENITERQINDLTFSLLNKIHEDKISFEAIHRYLNALDKSIYKIEEDLLYGLTVNVLNKQFIKNVMTRFLSQSSFDSIFESISQKKDGKFFGRIKENHNYDLIPKETRILMNKEILEDILVKNNAIPTKSKLMKI